MPGRPAERRAHKTQLQAHQQRRAALAPTPRPVTPPVEFPSLADLSPLAGALTPVPVGETPEPAPAPASAEFARRLDAELASIPTMDSLEPVGETRYGDSHIAADDLLPMVREETLDLLHALVNRGLHAHHLTPALGAQLHACVRAALTGDADD